MSKVGAGVWIRKDGIAEGYQVALRGGGLRRDSHAYDGQRGSHHGEDFELQRFHEILF